MLIGPADRGEQMSTALDIELRKQVIEQQHGSIAGARAHQLGLTQFERQRGAPLLAARSIGTDADAVHCEQEVVAVWADQRLPAPDLIVVHAFEVGQERLLDRALMFDPAAGRGGPLVDPCDAALIGCDERW